MNVAEALRKLPQPPSWTQREFADALLAMVKMDKSEAAKSRVAEPRKEEPI